MHDVHDIGITAVKAARTCGAGWRRWVIRRQQGLRRNERGFEGRRGRWRGNEGGGRTVRGMSGENMSGYCGGPSRGQNFRATANEVVYLSCIT